MILMLTACSTAALIAVFANGWETSPAAYAVYVLAIYTLTVFCLACWKTFPGYCRSIRRKVYDNRYASRYLTDPVFRTHVSLYISLGLIGIGILAAAYPVYNHVIRKERERIAPEILRLTDELMK